MQKMANGNAKGHNLGCISCQMAEQNKDYRNRMPVKILPDATPSRRAEK